MHAHSFKTDGELLRSGSLLLTAAGWGSHMPVSRASILQPHLDTPPVTISSYRSGSIWSCRVPSKPLYMYTTRTSLTVEVVESVFRGFASGSAISSCNIILPHTLRVPYPLANMPRRMKQSVHDFLTDVVWDHQEQGNFSRSAKLL